ncbi:MAG: antibiotic biosynthesis monooxygenase [Tissierellia bacterium]|nr:antibiotic biosynthesis monooxygenase [Tissierellia bacterium]
MIKIVVKKKIKEGKIDEAIKLYQELVLASQKEEGCIQYNLYQDNDDENILFIIEEWEDQEALDKHNKTEHFTRLVPMIAELVEESEMNKCHKLF